MDSGLAPNGAPRNDRTDDYQANNSLRQKSNFSSSINADSTVQSCPKKYFASCFPQITSIFPSSRPARGAFRDRHERWARDAVDALARETNAFEADGEVVWSRYPDADIKWATIASAIAPAMVTTKPGSPDHKGNR